MAEIMHPRPPAVQNLGMSDQDGAPHLPGIYDLFTYPLSDLCTLDRTLLRAMAMLARRKVLAVNGLEHVSSAHDPFIIALNHSTRGEALWIPAILILMRHGQRIHFLADWNFRMIPGVGLLYARAGAITVPRKSARPRFLNALKPLYTDPIPPLEHARHHLISGRSIGIFPEGAVNRDQTRLLRGRYGAARLSLETGVPVVPAGIRFPGLAAGERPLESTPFIIDIAAPLVPPSSQFGNSDHCSIDGVQAWHAQIMQALSRASGKNWQPRTQEQGHADIEAHHDASGRD